ncbi:MAG: CHAT domain-containing protein [Candidatus Omnitrophica bacterium]|nr:CHAT domain-containing protein [Candidatus Omnitrophota bacterium]
MAVQRQQANPLVLEVLWEGASLKMSVLRQSEASSTVRHYGRIAFCARDVDRLSSEIASILSRGDKGARLDQAGLQGLRKTGQLLWDHLLTREAKEKLGNAAGEELVLCLDEELIGMPWEFLHDGRDFLSLNFSIGRVIRSRRRLNTAACRSAPSRPRILILANPTSDLKSAYAEGVYVRRYFDRLQGRAAVDFKSTQIDTLYVKKNLRDYDIVHFAGHCEYNDSSPKQSGWVLNDGVFSIQDILALSETSPLPGLVFSNACFSARHSASAVDETSQRKTYNLASSFLFAGVRHYIGSIWRIEDAPAEVFAGEFYARLVAGESIGGSVRGARLRVIKECGHACIAWAGYALYGDPACRFFEQKKSRPAMGFHLWKAGRKKVLAAALAAAAAASFLLFASVRASNPGPGALFSAAQRQFNRGQNQDAITLCEDTLRRDPGFLKARLLMGDAYQRQGMRREALKAYFDYALLSEKQGDLRRLAAAYIAIGWTYSQLGQYEKAFEFYNKAVDKSRENKDKLNEAIALRKLALWNMERGNNEQALELLTKSSEINREFSFRREHRYNLACDYFDLGLFFINKDDLDAARQFYAKSRDLFRRLKLKAELSDFYFNLGEIYGFEKQYQKAMDCYLRGLAIDRAQGNMPNIASDYNMLGELCMETKDIRGALGYFEQALAVCRRIEAPLELASVYCNLASVYRANNQVSKARESLRLAQEIYYPIDTLRYQELRSEIIELSAAR